MEEGLKSIYKCLQRCYTLQELVHCSPEEASPCINCRGGDIFKPSNCITEENINVKKTSVKYKTTQRPEICLNYHFLYMFS